jgi:hypothetical protein
LTHRSSLNGPRVSEVIHRRYVILRFANVFATLKMVNTWNMFCL